MHYDSKNIVSIPVNPVRIGKIGKAYGILGWVKIISFTHKSGDIFNYSPWFIYLKCNWQLMYLDKWRFLSKYYIAKIKDISNRESAALLTNFFIVVDNVQFPCLPHNEYYCKDLIGCLVMLVDHGIYLGNVINIIVTNANDVLVVKINKKSNFYKKKECLIPFIQDKVIKNVNLDTHIIVVDWIIDF